MTDKEFFINGEVPWVTSIMFDLNSESLKSFRLKLLPESYLFLQGADADSVYFILSGYVVLCDSEWEKETYVNFVGPGEVLGEHLFFGVERTNRLYSAQAKTAVECVRFSLDEISTLKENNPVLYTRLLESSGNTLYQRLMRANKLIHCFKFEKKADRLMHLIVYLVDTFGRQTDKGREVYLPATLFKFYMNIPNHEFEHCISGLVEDGVLKPMGNSIFLLANKTLLMQRLPKIVDQLPTFPII
jgi:CRP-like cAMP-binding protein